jgi:hypothetical protein
LQKRQDKLRTDMPTKLQVTDATELLLKALAEKNVPFNFVSSCYFQAYVKKISKQRFSAPSRYYLLKSLDHLCHIITSKLKIVVMKSAFVPFCADSWTKAGRHLTAITGGAPGRSLYLGSYESNESETAEVVSKAVHGTLLETLGFKATLSIADKEYPNHKVSVFTSDTTNLMPATARAMRAYPLLSGLIWVPCFSHIANLLLLDQLQVTCVAPLLAHCKQITNTFRVGLFRKLFMMCASLPPECACSFTVD